MVKNTFLHPSTHFYRKILPLEKQTIIPIYKLSIYYKNRKSFIRLHPSKIHMQSSYLLSFLDSTSENITIDLNNSIKRQDLLSATEKMIMDGNDGCDSCYNVKIDLQNEKRKKPLNAFLIYSNSLRRKIRRKFPEYSNSDVSKLLGIMWRTASEEIKEKFFQLANEEKQRFKQQQHFSHENTLKKQESGTAENMVTQNGYYDGEWLNDINEFLQEIKEFEKDFNSELNPEDMKEDAINLINSLIEESDINHGNNWQSSSLFDDNIDINSWRDMINTITILYPDQAEKSIISVNNIH
ncbi:unnamed protein product [Cunninghamella blakesleeana]